MPVMANLACYHDTHKLVHEATIKMSWGRQLFRGYSPQIVAILEYLLKLARRRGKYVLDNRSIIFPSKQRIVTTTLEYLLLKSNERFIPFPIEQRHVNFEQSKKRVCNILYACRFTISSPRHLLQNAILGNAATTKNTVRNSSDIFQDRGETCPRRNILPISVEEMHHLWRYELLQ